VAGFQRRGFGGRKKVPPSNPADPAAARQKAIGLVARRDFGSRELKGRLAEAGYESGAAEDAVSDLQDQRLVDDARYAESAVASRVARGQGPIRIALELRRAGVAAELIEAAVEAGSPEWADRAHALRRRRFGAAPPADPKERTRQVRFLLYRGFSSEHVRKALGRVAADLTDDDLVASDDPSDLDALED
jgi:regulatory protein